MNEGRKTMDEGRKKTEPRKPALSVVEWVRER